MDLLDAAAALPGRPGHAALRALGERLRAYDVDPADIDAVMTGEPRRFLAQHPDGPILALRWYEPDYVSTVHSHAWTILRGLAGSGTLERFALVDGKAKAHSREPTDPPGICVIDGDEIHRQHAGPDGALELVIIRAYDAANPQVEYAT
jgi:hypothetical protein